MLKGQTSIELGIIIAFLLVILMTLLDVSLGDSSQVSNSRKQYFATTVAKSISSSINSVYVAGDGAQKTITLPLVLDTNEPYTATVSGRTVEVKWGDKRYLEALATSSTNSANLTPGTTVTIRNKGGLVIFE